MLPMPKKVLRATRGNAFWDVVKKTLPKMGYMFQPEIRGDNLFVSVAAMDKTGRRVDVSYPVPKIVKDFRTVFNYESQLKNFMRDYMAEKGLQPLSAELRPTRTVQQLRSDPSSFRGKAEALFAKPIQVFEKKKIVPAAPKISVLGAPIWTPEPYIPEEQPVAAPIPSTVYTFEQLLGMPPDQVVLAQFAGPVAQLLSIIELATDCANFVGANPVPVKTETEEPESMPRAATTTRRKMRPAFEVQNKMLKFIKEKGLKTFTPPQFKSVVRNDQKCVGNTLINMTKRGLVDRVDVGVYKLTTEGRKEATRVSRIA